MKSWKLAAAAPMLILPLYMMTSAVQADSAAEEAATYETILNYVNQKLKAFPTIDLRSDLGEHIIEGEEQAIEVGNAAIVKTIVHRAYVAETPGITKGDHGKTHACLDGSIKFFDQIPANLQRGVAVPGAEYKVQTRISNADQVSATDRASTSQGVALKLKNVSSVVGKKARLPDFPNTDEQDFLMTSDTVFFLPNIVEYTKAINFRAGNGGAIKFLVDNPIDGIKRLVSDKTAGARGRWGWIPGAPTNMMTRPYWSKHPYAWGEKNEGSVAVKYSVTPCENADKLTETSSEQNYQQDFIREAFQKNGEICYYLRVQTRNPKATEKNQPIEDASVEWKESSRLKPGSASPFVNIAKVTFKADQNAGWDSFEAITACNATEFTPWNGLMAHQPLSNIARGRRTVYKASALTRDAVKDLNLVIHPGKNGK